MIPIIINNFNRLSTTKKLVEDLIRLGYTDIHILDNGSTYPPLLEWYKEVEKEFGNNSKVQIQYLSNLGPRALWDSGYIKNFQHLDWIAYTDSDIELNEKISPSFIKHLVRIAGKYHSNKVGLSLNIADLPKNEMTDKIFNWEKQFWIDCLEGDSYYIWKADIDTTFAVIRPQLPFDYKALRVAGNFTAKHIPWFTDFSNLTEEEEYIMERLDSKYSTLKGYYLQHLENKKNG